MSMYNMVFGVNPLAGELLAILSLRPSNLGRLRDASLFRKAEGELEIHVLTRNGGGNREDFLHVFEAISKHPNYLRDWDEDDWDSTYASIAFSVPPEHRAILEKIVGEHPELIPLRHKERFDIFMKKLKDKPDDPEVLAVVEKMKPAMEKLTEALNEEPTGEVKVIEI